MIILDHNAIVIEHSGFPAVCLHRGNYASYIQCKDFTTITEWAIIDERGRILPELERSWWGEMREGELLISELPKGFQVRIKPAQELMKGETGNLSIDQFNSMVDKDWATSKDEINEIVDTMIAEEHEKYMETIDAFEPEVIPCPCARCEKEPEMNLTHLESFDILVKGAREWWFQTLFGTDKLRQMKADAGIDPHDMIGTIDMIRMFLNEGEWEGIREEVEPKENPFEKNPYLPEAYVQQLIDLEDMRNDNKIREEFNQMFGNRYNLLSSPSTSRMEAQGLKNKIIEWAQGL